MRNVAPSSFEADTKKRPQTPPTQRPPVPSDAPKNSQKSPKGRSESLRGSGKSLRAPRTRSVEDMARVQAHKSHRGSTQVTPNTSVMEYQVPKKKVLQSDTDRWLRLSHKVGPFVKGLEQYLASMYSVVITCECTSLTYSRDYETVALTVPKEILALAKHRIRSGRDVPFKLVAQEKLSAFEMLERLREIFTWVEAEKGALEQVVRTKGTVDLAHVVQLQFFYKYYLRVLNHWNYAHPTEGGGIPVALQRNFLLTISDRAAGGFLGIVLNEMDFLRATLKVRDPDMPLSPRMSREDLGSPGSPLSGSSSGGFSLGGSGGPKVSRSSSGWSIGPTRRHNRDSPPGTGSNSPSSQSPGTSPGSSPRKMTRTSVSSTRLDASTSSIQIPTKKVQKKHHSQQECLEVLQRVYVDKALEKRFREFAATKYAEENVLFLLALSRVKAADVSSRAELLNKLYLEFLDEKSENEVNLSSKARKNLLRGISEGELESLAFCDLALREVEHQVVQNLCNDFLNEDDGGDEIPAGSPPVVMQGQRVKSPGRRASLLDYRGFRDGDASPVLEVSEDTADADGSDLRLSSSGSLSSLPPPRPSRTDSLEKLSQMGTAEVRNQRSESLISARGTPAEQHKASSEGFVKPRQFAKPLPLLPPSLIDAPDKDVSDL